MKKIFFSFMALAVLASCNKIEPLSVEQGDLIDFGSAFVDNSTKAATDPSFGTKNPLSQFQVWGTANNVAIFDGVAVTGTVGSGSVWTCTKKQYWINGVDYKFAAVVNGNVKTLAEGLPATISYEADGTSDLLYADTKNTEIKGMPTGQNTPVKFTFAHLLSKVKFTVNTTDVTEGYVYKVTGIKISNAYASGTYTVADNEWEGVIPANNPGQSFSYIILNATSVECDAEKLLIPTSEVKVSYTVALYYTGNGSEEQIWSQSYTDVVAKKADNTNVELEAAKSYNFNITLNVGEEIKFSVEEYAGWDKNGSQTGVTL